MSSLEYVNKKAIKIVLPVYHQEKNWTCGASALRSILAFYGKGPITEDKVCRGLKMTTDGIDPYQIINLVKKIGLHHAERRKMTQAELIEFIDQKIPVMIMIQAMNEDFKKDADYEKDYDDGHWVVVTGYDKKNFYFEDPGLYTERGYIERKSLNIRWHDIESYGPDDKVIHKTKYFGVAIWGDKTERKYLRKWEKMKENNIRVKRIF